MSITDLACYVVSDCTVPITDDIQDIMTCCFTGHIDKLTKYVKQCTWFNIRKGHRTFS